MAVDDRADDADVVDEVFWEDLLYDIRAGAVVPVIGSDLLSVGAGPERVNLADRLAEDFAAKHLRGDDDPSYLRGDQRRTGRSSLAIAAARYRAACRYGDDPDLVYPAVRRLLKAAYESAVPAPLEKLAEIADFKLIVTTTPDRWVHRALARQGRDPQVRAFALNGAHPEDRDLPHTCSAFPLRSWPATFVYHLLGVEGPRDFAVTEEDMLEFMHQLQEPAWAPEVLLEILNQSRLLLIGCRLPDWLTRFLVRVTTRKRLKAPGATHVVVGGTAQDDLGLGNFLNLFTRGVKIWHGGSVDFVEELHDRWKKTDGAAPSASPGIELEPFLRGRIETPAGHASNGRGTHAEGAATGAGGRAVAAGGRTVAAGERATEAGGGARAAGDRAEADPAVSFPPRKPARGVFLSYASEDRDKVEKLKDELEAHGLEVWFDKASLKGGDRYEAVIRQLIRECDAFVPVISRNVRHELPGSRGRFFRREWKWARDREEEYRELNEGVPDEYLTNFICPISIDGTSAQEVQRWAEYHWPARQDFPHHMVEIVQRREVEKFSALYGS